MYVQAALHQLQVAIRTIVQMLDTINEEELDFRPSPAKRSLYEIFSHLSLLMQADFFILNEATKDEIAMFYDANEKLTIKEMQLALFDGYNRLSYSFSNYSEEDLHEITTSYWGVSYTRFEWLIQIVAHMYHHRGQLHILLCEQHMDPRISLFE